MPPFPFSPPWFRPTAAIPSITKLAKRFETIVDVLNALPHVDGIASETFPHLVREVGNQRERRSEALKHMRVQRHVEEDDVASDKGIACRDVAYYHHGDPTFE